MCPGGAQIVNPGEQLQRLIGGMGPIAYLLITQEGDLKPKPPAGWGSDWELDSCQRCQLPLCTGTEGRITDC